MEIEVPILTGNSLGIIALLLVANAPVTLHAQSPGAAHLKSGQEIYEAGCAGCHGAAGKGAPQSAIGFDKPRTFPDFTQCDQTTPEDNLAWKAVIHGGGPSRAFSPIMPSFSEALSFEQMEAVVRYIRGFCTGKGWPRGELNLPRAIGTEKAFPEDETVISTTFNVQGGPGVTNEIIHEQRFGVKNQLEVSVPIDFQRPQPGRWYGGLDDIGIGIKRVLFSSLRTGSIVSLQGEGQFPTGNSAHGIGSGVFTFETFAAYGQLLPFDTFFQFQGGADLPTDTHKSPQSLFFRGAFGKSFHQSTPWGRLWSPMVEFLSDRNLVTGADTDLDIMPEMQVTISKRQHIRFDAGLRIPANNTAGRQKQLMFYVLWDWQDGRLLEGWK